MKKIHHNDNSNKHEDEKNEVEILKAVAQAWHGHSSTSKTTTEASEFDAHRRFFKGKPSRFKLEAIAMGNRNSNSNRWDFKQSLWDSYEIVAVTKKLERGLILDDAQQHAFKKRRESKSSLRSLLRMSSKRFNENDFHLGDY